MCVCVSISTLVPHLGRRWCTLVPAGTSSCTAPCRAAGRARTESPSLGPRCSSTRTWSRCSGWWTPAGTWSAGPRCSSSPSCCLEAGQSDGEPKPLPARSPSPLVVPLAEPWPVNPHQYIRFRWSSARSRRCTRSGSCPPC